MRAARAVLVVSLLAAFPVSAKRHSVGEPFHLHPAPPTDVFSAARPAEARTYHLALDLTVDFEKKQLRGSATHSILNLTGTRQFIVDTRDLEIAAVTIDGAATTWSLAPSPNGSRALTIDIAPSTHRVRIDYATPAGVPFAVNGPLRWLTPAQTLGRTAPFLFTFSQPDRARGWIPVQDSPGVKMTYEARIAVPHGLMAVMSARNNPARPSPDGVYTFWMERPTSSYLIALAVGRLEFHALDERTGFYAEPEMVEDALWELQYIPAMLDAAEGILGPYPYARYDLLLAPPSFTAGGMENPMLNFYNALGMVDGSRESPPQPSGIAAHEIAHSWAGDFVTCGSWSDMWLNEGFATYYDKRIMEALGETEWAEWVFYNDRQSFAAYAQLPVASTTMHRPFRPGDRPLVFGMANYQKGSLFLKTLEDLAGRTAFDAFIREYFARHANRWADSSSFAATLRETLLAGRPELEARLRVDEWVYGSGLPSNVTAPAQSALQTRIVAQANAFRSGTPASALDTAGWTQREIAIFLPMIGDIMTTRMPELDAAFGFSQMELPPTYWVTAVARARYAPGMASLEHFLEVGGWNVAPVYMALRDYGNRLYAISTYARLRETYGPDLQAYLDRMVHETSLVEERIAA